MDPKREVRSSMDIGEFGDLTKVWVHFMGYIIMDKVIAKWVSEYYGPKFLFPC